MPRIATQGIFIFVLVYSHNYFTLLQIAVPEASLLFAVFPVLFYHSSLNAQIDAHYRYRAGILRLSDTDSAVKKVYLTCLNL